MKVLVACEYSGVVRDAFLRHGHDAISCDLLPTDQRGPHYMGDVRRLLKPGIFDLMIAHPPCTYLAASGLHWNNKRPGRVQFMEDAIQFVMDLANAPIEMIAIENPIGILSTRWRKPDQIIQPWQFGHDASKSTCLWLKGLPPLQATNTLPGDRKTRRGKTKSGQNRLGPTANRWKLRSTTYYGIGEAMADQWGSYGETEVDAG